MFPTPFIALNTLENLRIDFAIPKKCVQTRWNAIFCTCPCPPAIYCTSIHLQGCFACPTMCASARNVNITPPPPHLHPMRCVALTMCAGARGVNITTPPPHHPQPHTMLCVASTKSKLSQKTQNRWHLSIWRLTETSHNFTSANIVNGTFAGNKTKHIGLAYTKVKQRLLSCTLSRCFPRAVSIWLQVWGQEQDATWCNKIW